MDLDQTLPMLEMGHDGSEGRIVLREDGFAAVKWPGIKHCYYRRLIRSEFDPIARAHGGMLGSIHALQRLGQQRAAKVPQGCRIADGSIIPTSIACNPLLTISALAERIAEGIVLDPQHRDLFTA